MKRVDDLLDPAPFVAWFERQARAYGEAAVCARLGWTESGARKVYRWRHAGRCEDPLGLLDACVIGSVDFFTLFDEHFRREYPEPDSTLIGPQFPHACRWNVHYERVRARLLDEGEPAAADGVIWRYQKRPGKPVGVYGKMSEDQVRAANVLHLEGRISIRELGRMLWQKFGYASERSCAESICRSFKMYGLTTRTREEANVLRCTTHGLASREQARKRTPEYRALVLAQRRANGDIADAPFCAGVRLQYPRKGSPCRNRAMLGSIYCRQHEPALRDDVVATVARARQSLGLQSERTT